MNSIKDTVTNEITIEKSRFITYLFKCDNQIDAKSIILDMNKKYADATHVVYAFITEKDTRSNDNGEPKGTAGLPTLEVLRKEKMTNVLAVTIRYFGGIKLGAPGLVRAYTKGVSEALKKAIITHQELVSNITLNTSYKDSFYLDKNLNLAMDYKKEYDNRVTYHIKLLEKDLDNFKELFVNLKDEYRFELLNSEVLFI
ncbi:YigZ family protein [bacterium]|nr:YigZ family protein [bacterium]